MAAEGTLSSSGSRRALSGFFVSGMLLSFPGAILLSWQHHITGDYDMVALYFLGVIAGLLGSVWLSPGLLERRGPAWTLAFGCGLAGAALIYLAVFSPPWSPWFRAAGLALIGWAAGLIHTAIFHAIAPIYRHDPAATVNLAGILFGLGCFAQALLISLAFYMYTAPVIQAWMALIPALFGWLFWKTPFGSEPVPHQPPPEAILGALRNPGAVLLSLLLLFQLGSEWVVAGWLAVFLTVRLGLSPTTALWMLASYWLALLIGRVAAQWILPRLRHAYLLLGSVVGVMFACLVLLATNNQFGAITGVVLLGATFAPIYPLVVEKIGYRFPHYHPGFYNGIFSIALGGGFLAPALLGLIAAAWGVGAVMLFPVAGSLMVCFLLLLIWLEARLSTHVRPSEVA